MSNKLYIYKYDQLYLVFDCQCHTMCELILLHIVY